jgi:putative ABC transport system substrate-binding protein
MRGSIIEASMKRRDFLGALGGAVAAWPSAARAQPAIPVIGVLHSGTASAFVQEIDAFLRGLRSGGFVPGQNLAAEYRWAEGRQDRLPELAADLVRKSVAVIAALGGNAPALAVKSATTTIPIVFNTGADPVAAGLVQSYNRPGGNVTGVSFLVEQLGEKGLALLHELLPDRRSIGLLTNPRNPGAAQQIASVRDAAAKLGLTLEVVGAATSPELDQAFEALTARKAGALVMSADPLFGSARERIITLAARHRIPTMYYRREFAALGGLISYGTSANEAYSEVGEYVSRILKGARPADLPVSQVVKFELVINLKTARSLGIDIAPALSARADEIIE